MIILKKLAFTLAEVLIVIGIMGIVAEMTIPTLIASSQKQVELTSLKKFYSEFSQGLKQYMVTSDCSDLACTGMFDPSATPDWETNIDSKIRSAFKIVKSCNTGAGTCGHYLKKLDGTVYVDISWNPYSVAGHSFITQDGFLFSITPQAGNCDLWSANISTSKAKNSCAFIYVDTNADKPPNTWGRDAFFLVIGGDGTLYPTGGVEMTKISANSDNYSGNASYWRNNTDCGTVGSSVIISGSVGSNCISRVMEEGWQIKY